MRRPTDLFLLILLCSVLPGCNRTREAQGSQPLTPQQQTAKDQMDAAVAGAAKTAAAYKAMKNAELIEKLDEQSAARKEPFNSPAYRELVGRNDVDPKALAAEVEKTRNGDGLLALLLLRRQNQKAYNAIPAAVRAAVLTDALATSKRFNTWGLPNTYREDAPQALIEAGESAVPALKRLLSDKRPAPMMGSKEAMISQKYHLRVCDYALAYLERIKGDTSFRLPESVAGRDEKINEIPK